MQMYEYQLEACKTRNDSADMIYILGKMTVESGESLQLWLKHMYHGAPYDKDTLIEELGDVFWYLANAADYLQVTLEYIADANIAKLRKRHGGFYNPAHYATLPVFAATE